MAITYDLNTDIITVQYNIGDDKGGSFTNPYTFTDIYNESVLNGWGGITKNGNTFYIEKRIDVLGDTAFRSRYENITFKDMAGTLMYVNMPSSLNGGISFNMSNFYSETVQDAITFYTKGNIENCSFYNFQRINLYGNSNGLLNIKKTEFKFGLIVYFRNSYIYLEDVTFYNNSNPISPYYGIDNLRIKTVDCGNSFYLMYIQDDITLRNLIIKNSSYDIGFRPYNYKYITATLVDCDVDYNNYSISTGSYGSQNLVIKSTFYWYLGDNILINLYDKDNNLVLSKIINNGDYDEITYHTHFVACESVLINNDIVNYEPFKLVASKTGYDDLTIDNITITQGVATVIRGTLNPETLPIFINQELNGEVEQTSFTGKFKEDELVIGVVDKIINIDVNDTDIDVIINEKIINIENE